MPFLFSCGNCAANIKATNEIVGKSVRCPMCKAAVTVPASSGYSAPGIFGHIDGKTPETIVEGEIITEAEAMTAPESSKQIWLFLGTVGAVVLIGCVAAILLYHGLRGRNSDQSAQQAPPQSDRPAAKSDEPRKTQDVVAEIRSATNDGRRFWRFAKEHGSGYFKQLANGTWEEIGRGGERMGTWIERARTAEFVELEDQERGFLTRLGAGQAWLASNNDRKFNPSPHGDWERQP